MQIADGLPTIIMAHVALSTSSFGLLALVEAFPGIHQALLPLTHRNLEIIYARRVPHILFNLEI